MKRQLFPLFFILQVCFFSPTAGFGSVTWECLGKKLKWDSNSVRIRASGVSFPSGSSYRTALGTVISRLNRNPSNFDFYVTYDESKVKRGNGENETWFSSDPGALKGAPAITWWWYDCVDYWIFGGKDVELTEADVIFNVGVTWTSGIDKRAMWNYGGGARPFRTTAMHEFGHALGLAHEADEYNIMGQDWTHIHTNGDNARCYLGEDASDGTVYLYGTNSSAGEDLGVVHWRHTGHSGEYSTHDRARIFNSSNLELPKYFVNDEPIYFVNNGQTIKVEFSYENNGVNRQNPVGIGFYLSTNDLITTWDSRIGGFSADLGRNDVWTVSRTVSLPDTLQSDGVYYVGAIADENDVISEFDEANNASYTGIHVNTFTPTSTPTRTRTPTPTPTDDLPIQIITPFPILTPIVTLYPIATSTPTPTSTSTPSPTPTLTPTPTPLGDNCVTPGQYYGKPVDGLSAVKLGAIEVHAAIDSKGNTVSLGVSDCSDTGQLGIWIPWTESTASQPATIAFSEDLCRDALPKSVQITLRHYNHAILRAYDGTGALVDTASAAPSSAIQTLTLTGASGIRKITVEGSEICLLAICWECEAKSEPTFIRPSPTPARAAAPASQLVLSQGYGGKTSVNRRETSTLRIIEGSAFPGLPKNFAALLGTSVLRSANTAVGDIDGDGSNDIIVGFGPGGHGSIAPSVVTAWRTAGGIHGPSVITSFNVFVTSSPNPLLRNPHGALNLVAGDFVGADLPMVVAAQGLGGSNQLRILRYAEGVARERLEIAGTFQGLTGAAVRQNGSGGTSVAAGDLDNDGLDELLVGQMNGDGATTLFQVLNLAQSDDGRVYVEQRSAPIQAMPVLFHGLGGVNFAVGDVDGDGDNEIIAATAGDPEGANNPLLKNFIRIFDTSSGEPGAGLLVNAVTGPMQVFGASLNPSGGLGVAAGNVDEDPADEILVSTQAIIGLNETTGEVSFTYPAEQCYVSGLNIEVDEDGSITGFSPALPRFQPFSGDYNPLSGAVNIEVCPVE